MSNSNYTPGPWIWAEDYRGLYGAGQENDVLTHAAYEGMWLSYVENREANARLIAAAPDLLEALKLAAEAMGGSTDPTLLRRADAAARAAIAKATGSEK